MLKAGRTLLCELINSVLQPIAHALYEVAYNEEAGPIESIVAYEKEVLLACALLNDGRRGD